LRPFPRFLPSERLGNDYNVPTSAPDAAREIDLFKVHEVPLVQLADRR
jgi:hypothetical protein